MKINEVNIDFPETNEKYEVLFSGVGEIVSYQNNKIKIKIEIIRIFNIAFDKLGLPCYIDSYKEAKEECYPAIVELYLNSLIEISQNDNKILLDTTFVDVEYEKVKIYLDKENVKIKISPPLN